MNEPPVGSIAMLIPVGWGQWITRMVRHAPDGWVTDWGRPAGPWKGLQEKGYTVIRNGWGEEVD